MATGGFIILQKSFITTMPIAIGELSWTQCRDLVKLRVKLNPAVSCKSLDIFTHIKLNAPPFYREIFLFHPIDAASSKCKIVDRCVLFELKKSNPGLIWDHLEFDLSDKIDRIIRREKIVEDKQKEARDEQESRVQRKVDDKRKDMLKEIDRQNEERQSAEWTVQLIREDVKSSESQSTAITPAQTKKPVQSAPIRQPGSIPVTFSDRAFITPKRESQTPLEDDFLAKQMQLKRSIGFLEDDLREEEHNPVWLLAKGNEFYGHGNYLGAISAYSAGIRLNPESVELHLNRAGAHFCEKNYIRCAEDCSRTLQLIKESGQHSVQAKQKITIQSLARRGAALCKMGLLAEGHGELTAAWDLDQSNASLKEDLQEVQRRMEDTGIKK